MRYLKLINNKYVTQVDDNLFDKLNQYQWLINKDGYIFCWENNKKILLHRYIMNAKKNQIVDHIDNNPLNNQLSNLRICTIKENSYNKKNIKIILADIKEYFITAKFAVKINI